MHDKVERLVTTKDRDENITGMVMYHGKSCLLARPALPCAACSAKAASAARADGGRGAAAPACLNPLYLTGGYKSPGQALITRHKPA